MLIICSYTTENKLDEQIPLDNPLTEAFVNKDVGIPSRMEGNDLFKYSKVFEHTAVCTLVDFKRYNKTEGEVLEIVWEVNLLIVPIY